MFKYLLHFCIVGLLSSHDSLVSHLILDLIAFLLSSLISIFSNFYSGQSEESFLIAFGPFVGCFSICLFLWQLVLIVLPPSSPTSSWLSSSISASHLFFFFFFDFTLVLFSFLLVSTRQPILSFALLSHVSAYLFFHTCFLFLFFCQC